MRISCKEKEIIKEAILQEDAEAKIYLFGSRTDDKAKGGDIDLLVITNKLDYKNKLNIRTLLFKKMEDQKIDIVIAKNFDAPFIKTIFPTALPL